VVDLMIGIQRLDNARTTEEFVDAVWDLRDSAFDEPQLWSALTAETLLQALAESLENAPTERSTGQPANQLLAQAFRKALQAPAE
jgi:hypothetical protein